MSKVTAPFMSLGAAGQFAKTLVAAKWKGIPYMRKYVVPANPQTDAQVAHRAVWTAAVAAYKNYLTDSAIRTAWRKLASGMADTMSGFNAAVQALVAIMTDDGDASFCTASTEASGVNTFTMKNMDDGATGDESGDFEVWAGLTATNLSLADEIAIAAGAIAYTHGYDVGTVYFVKLRKGGYDRSGIFQVTATAA